MKIIRFLSSKRFTLVLMAIVSGAYLSRTFGNDNPWDSMLVLLRESRFMEIIVLLTCLHFFIKGAYRFITGKTRQAPSALIFVSLSIFISGMYFSINFRDAERLRVCTSDKISNGVLISGIKMDIPPNILAVGESSEFKINAVEAIIDDHGKKRVKSYPFVKTSAGYAYIKDAGISPTFNASVKGNDVSVSKLQLLPPNRAVSLQAAQDYRIEVSLFPEKEFKKGRLTARQYSLFSPKYRTIVKKGNDVLFDRVLNDRQSAKGNGVELSFSDTKKWVEVVMVKDKAVILIYFGLIGLCAGIIFYPVEMYYYFRG